MNWLPHFYRSQQTIADRDWEAKGWLIGFHWGRLVIEFSINCKNRFFDAETGRER